MSYEPLKVSDARRCHLTEAFRQFTLMSAARTEYGIESPGHVEAVASALDSGHLSVADLVAAKGDGPALTTLLRNAPSNPHKELIFTTPFDLILHPELSLKQ
ncbi:hypothetical protein [Zavarzinella formosa]|uniref:hypothetical protein n=1 Tax=Zavarzinella formosa TaxID=360055 RepID=UPI0002F119E1|nr:hypothetical protein [Zavarzinella formosa]